MLEKGVAIENDDDFFLKCFNELKFIGFDCFHVKLGNHVSQTSTVKYVLKKGILLKQRMHQRIETRVCKFSGPD